MNNFGLTPQFSFQDQKLGQGLSFPTSSTYNIPDYLSKYSNYTNLSASVSTNDTSPSLTRPTSYSYNTSFANQKEKYNTTGVLSLNPTSTDNSEINLVRKETDDYLKQIMAKYGINLERNAASSYPGSENITPKNENSINKVMGDPGANLNKFPQTFTSFDKFQSNNPFLDTPVYQRGRFDDNNYQEKRINSNAYSPNRLFDGARYTTLSERGSPYSSDVNLGSGQKETELKRSIVMASYSPNKNDGNPQELIFSSPSAYADTKTQDSFKPNIYSRNPVIDQIIQEHKEKLKSQNSASKTSEKTFTSPEKRSTGLSTNVRDILQEIKTSIAPENNDQSGSETKRRLILNKDSRIETKKTQTISNKRMLDDPKFGYLVMGFLIGILILWLLGILYLDL